jgi:hypothetical protein
MGVLKVSDKREKVVPSTFMRRLRPEYYSDTADRTTYQLDAPTLEYHLETITARNQTHDFEIFCRKLCERTICPNLKPATGPEGGGDSKADTETIPIADEIATLSYTGEANAGSERWAFAFSAKRTWSEKVRNDVAGIIATHRGYQKIYCITARFARAKDRARLEDELTKQHGVSIIILDRTWIVEQVIDGDRKDLAFNYLSVGQEIADARRLGPSDYSRAQQLDDIERVLSDPQAFAGMKLQRVTEALVAAKLSRNLERPRTETDGRFTRAIRLADTDGTYRQQLEANYERIWTGFWWFDDIALLNTSYDAFATLALETDHARNLEFLCNLAQLLFNAVIHGHLTADEAKLTERIARLSHRLDVMARDVERPNNALEARTSLLVIRVNQALIDGDPVALAALWPQFSEVVEQAKGLGEFPADRLTQMIEVFGNVAANNPGYASLVDQFSAFVAERTSEAQGALVLLKRAQQLDFNDCFEMIRLLGRAGHQLTKKEYTGSLIEAMRLLSLAYRSAGLLWAARASCIFAIASIFIEADEDNDIPASVVPTIMLLGWITVELRHLPDAFEAIQLVRGCVAGLPLTEASKELAEKRLQEFDMVLSSQIMNFTPAELQQSIGLPDVLDGLGLHNSRTSLLYALGYEQLLRDEGWIPTEETPKKLTELYTLLASQPASDNLYSPVIFNEPGSQFYVSTVLGIRIEVRHQGSEASTLAAEAVIGSIEALYATTINLDAPPHAEVFTVVIEESADASEPTFAVDPDRMTATIRWPAGLLPATYGQQGEIQKILVGLAGYIFTATCAVRDINATFTHFFKDDAVLHRVAMIAVAGNSHQRLFKSGVARLSGWTKLAEKTFALRPSRPNIVRRKLNPREDEREKKDQPAGKLGNFIPPKDHRGLNVRSIIDIHLWDRAGWSGTAFADWGPPYPPAIALLFTDADAARKIFERWHERFGRIDKQDDIYLAIVPGISANDPAHYRVLITSRLRPEDELPSGQQFMVASRMNTMHAESDVNLVRFLEAYGRSGGYALLPAVWKGHGEPELLSDLAIQKRKLSIKAASEIGDNDIEMMALGPDREFNR